MASTCRRILQIATCLAAAAVGFPSIGLAGTFPSQKMQLIVPYSPGSGVDLLARTYAQALEKQFGVPIVVENREGATGTIGSLAAARAPADGYTFMVNANPPFAVAPLSLKTPTYDVRTNFTPIARIGSVPLVLITGWDSPVKTFEQLKVQAAAHPEAAMYASTGNGSPGQIYMETIKGTTGMKLVEVPYKSSTQALADVIGGHILASVVSLPAADQLIQAGRLRVLAVGAKARLKRFPEAPTFGEVLGQPGFDASVWYGFLAPAQVAPEKIKALYLALSKAFQTDEARERMSTLGLIPELLAPAAFAEALQGDVENAHRMMEIVSRNAAR